MQRLIETDRERPPRSETYRKDGNDREGPLAIRQIVLIVRPLLADNGLAIEVLSHTAQ
jgi:hypothetical protein